MVVLQTARGSSTQEPQQAWLDPECDQGGGTCPVRARQRGSLGRWAVGAPEAPGGASSPGQARAGAWRSGELARPGPGDGGPGRGGLPFPRTQPKPADSVSGLLTGAQMHSDLTSLLEVIRRRSDFFLAGVRRISDSPACAVPKPPTTRP